MKRLSIFLFAVFSVVLISSLTPNSGYAQNTPPTPPPQTPGAPSNPGAPGNPQVANSDSAQAITGTVLDANTGQPVSGATVQLEGQDNSVTTDSDGSFQIENASAGTYTITVTADGYQDYENQIEVGANAQSLTIRLTPGENQ